jgi:hypothetical protein
MLKIVPLAVGLLTVLSIVPNAQAFPLQQPISQPQLAIVIGSQQPTYQGKSGYYGHSRYNYRAAELRRLELERQREIAAERRRHQYYSHHHNNGYYNNANYNTGVYRAPVNDRDGYNNRGGYDNNQNHHNR